MKLLLVVFLGSCFALMSALAAETIYVDNVKGDDANPGTEAKPFRTIAKGLKELKRGATMKLVPNAEPYHEAIPLRAQHSGFWDSYTTVDGCGATVEGMVPPAKGGWKDEGNGVWSRFLDNNAWVMDDLGHWCGAFPLVRFGTADGVNVTSRTDLAEGCYCLYKRADKDRAAGHNTLYVKTPGGRNPDDVPVSTVSSWMNASMYNCEYVKVMNLTIRNQGWDCFSSGSCTNCIFENVDGSHAMDQGISAHGSVKLKVRKSRFHHNTGGGIVDVNVPQTGYCWTIYEDCAIVSNAYRRPLEFYGHSDRTPGASGDYRLIRCTVKDNDLVTTGGYCLNADRQARVAFDDCEVEGKMSVFPVRPYEMVDAGRAAPPQKPILRLDDERGWTVSCTNAVASVGRDYCRAVYADYPGSLQLTYRATGADPKVVFAPATPAPIAAAFNTVTVWVHGNNIYGGGAPITRLFALFRDQDGKPFEVQFIALRHKEWNLMRYRLPEALAARVRKGGAFVGFRLEDGKNTDNRQLRFSALCAFEEEDRPLELTARAAELAKPMNTKSVLPPCAKAHDELEFRLPEDPTNWDDLAFRWKGSEWIRLAKGGGLLPAGKAKDAKVTFSRVGDTLVAEIETATPGVEEIRFGGLYEAPEMHRFAIPFLTTACWPDSGGMTFENRPCVYSTVLGGETVFLSAHFDWTYSACSQPYVDRRRLADGSYPLNWGVRYLPKTDGVRNTVRERFFWTVSPTFEDTFPSIPNAPSEWHDRLGEWVWRAHGVGTRSADFGYYRGLKNLGFDKLMVTDHETGWRDGEESFTFRTNAAPAKGGNAAQRQYARDFIDGLGHRYGIYDNFTDLAPVNAYWDVDRVSRDPDGQLKEAWYRCYQPKAYWALEMSERLSPVIESMYGLNCVYCDVKTATTPWGRTDYDARVPGGGSYLPFFNVFGEILMNQKRHFRGPVLSEGGLHWMYAGKADGNFALDLNYELYKNPWIVDFDLRRIHPLEVDFGLAETREITDGLLGDRYLAGTVAFGHGVYLMKGPGELNRINEFRSYYMLRELAVRYTKAKAVSILYGARDAEPVPISEAVKNGFYRFSQIATRYDDGTLTWANGSTNETFTVRTCGGRTVLPPGGVFAKTADGKIVVWSGLRGKERSEFAATPDCFFVWGRGTFASFPGGGADGILVRKLSADAKERVIVHGSTLVELPYAAKGADVAFEITGGRTRFRPVRGKSAYEFIKPSGFTEPSAAESEKAVNH